MISQQHWFYGTTSWSDRIKEKPVHIILNKDAMTFTVNTKMIDVIDKGIIHEITFKKTDVISILMKEEILFRIVNILDLHEEDRSKTCLLLYLPTFRRMLNAPFTDNLNTSGVCIEAILRIQKMRLPLELILHLSQ